MGLEFEDATGPIIGAAIDVHRGLGPGFLEATYENALAYELGLRGIKFQRQVSVTVLYDGQVVGAHRIDLVVSEQVVVEVKAVMDITDAHFCQVCSYLRALRRTHGLILNFAKPSLEVKRVKAPPAP